MEFNSQLLFFFSALGAFNGLILGVYFLFYAKPRHISNRFLGMLLVVLSVRIGKSVLFYFNPDLASLYLQIGLSTCLFIGPFLYFYLTSVFKPENTIHKTWKYHLYILVPTILIMGYKYPFKTNSNIWREYIIMGIYFIWFLYTIVSGYRIKHLFKKLLYNRKKIKNLEVWTLSIYLGSLTILIAFYSFRYTYYIVGALSFTFVIYLLILLLIIKKKKSSVLYKSYRQENYKELDINETKRLINLLESKMKNDELFKDSNLKLPDLAKILRISVHHLSQLLNDYLGKSFYEFINDFRIAEAKNLILENKAITIEAIGYDCGFNSKSTFYSAFKKQTGITPSTFKKYHSTNL